jgi:hypothetical protein
VRERRFRIGRRRRQVRLVELDDLVAVRRSDGRLAPDAANEVPESLARAVSPEQVEAFHRAGWVFKRRDPAAPASDAEDAQVFVRPTGGLVLGTNRLTVQLRDDPTEDEANALLRAHGVRVARRLTFAPGLFEAELTERGTGDAIDAVNELAASDEVVFAEPELIEQLVRRPP